MLSGMKEPYRKGECQMKRCSGKDPQTVSLRYIRQALIESDPALAVTQAIGQAPARLPAGLKLKSALQPPPHPCHCHKGVTDTHRLPCVHRKLLRRYEY